MCLQGFLLLQSINNYVLCIVFLYICLQICDTTNSYFWIIKKTLSLRQYSNDKK
jgi:hypothetical protein